MLVYLPSAGMLPFSFSLSFSFALFVAKLPSSILPVFSSPDSFRFPSVLFPLLSLFLARSSSRRFLADILPPFSISDSLCFSLFLAYISPSFSGPCPLSFAMFLSISSPANSRFLPCSFRFFFN